MIPKLRTLTRRADFVAMATTKRKAVRPTLILQVGKKPPHLCDDPYNQKPHEDNPKTAKSSHAESPSVLIYGLTASRKVGNAVVRNRAKRRLRALVRTVMATHAVTDNAYVLIARAYTATCRWEVLRNDLERALRQINAWRAGS